MRRLPLVRLLLAPLALLYGIGVFVRNFLYESGLYKPVRFDVPVIVVGNLAVGGTGKTPHVEYLIRLLDPYINVGTLSRGYGRKTSGFRIVNATDSALTAGDEPLQFKRKFPDVTVAVGEDRVTAIPRLMGHRPDLQVIIMDDGLQHLSVKPYLSMLLTAYSDPYFKDYLLPAGNLREWRSGASRADVIVVTKCPADLSETRRDAILNQIAPQPHQQVFFSRYRYGTPYFMYDSRQRLHLTKDVNILLVSGLASADYLVSYLKSVAGEVFIADYPDHHPYTAGEIEDIAKMFANVPGSRKVIITTEKDAVRLDAHRNLVVERRLPFFLLPVEVQFLFDEQPRFDTLIKQRLLDFTI